MRLRQRLLAAAVLGALFAPPVCAGLFDDTEARQRIDQLRTGLTETQGKLDGVARNQLDFANQIEALRAEIARINGQLEVLKYDLESAQKRQQDFYVDLDNRLRKLESAAVAEASAEGAPPAAANPAATAAGSGDADAYEKAITALKGGKGKDAVAAFDSFIATYPQSKLLGSAHYWNGYARSQLKDYRGAAAMFGKFAADWPDDPRAPDALEGQADNLAASKEPKAARLVMQRLAEKYPASDAGKRARLQLKTK